LSTFNRRFRRLLGANPGAYRASRPRFVSPLGHK
jgi:AraC-like DNA-binding protein